MPEHDSQGKEAIMLSPMRLPISFKILAVSCGFEHTLLLNDKYQIYGFGKNNNGQLFPKDKKVKFIAMPTLLDFDQPVSEITASTRGSFFITRSKEVYAQGSNKNLELGLQ